MNDALTTDQRCEVLPCPYCGMTTDDLCGVEYGRKTETAVFFVQCVNCSVRMEQDRMDKVVGMWNARVVLEKKDLIESMEALLILVDSKLSPLDIYEIKEQDSHIWKKVVKTAQELINKLKKES